MLHAAGLKAADPAGKLEDAGLQHHDKNRADAKRRAHQQTENQGRQEHGRLFEPRLQHKARKAI